MMNNAVRVNREYKDRLFRMLFGSEELKENIVSLYNAVNNTTYTDPDDFEITTLEDVIYIRMKNDVSLLVGSYLSLWEQQSTKNPNMPLRGLMYFGSLYENYIDARGANIYGSKLIKIPNPQYIVFYNGNQAAPPVSKLRLSEAFMETDDIGEFEWTATMYNLNHGKNDTLLEHCKPLKEYMTLIDYIRDYQAEGMSLQAAVNQAIDRCIEEDVMRKFLRKTRAEVLNMILTEFNEAVFVKGIREEGIEEGLEKGAEIGREEGRIETLIGLVRKNLLPLNVAAAESGMSAEEFKKAMKKSSEEEK